MVRRARCNVGDLSRPFQGRTTRQEDVLLVELKKRCLGGAARRKLQKETKTTKKEKMKEKKVLAVRLPPCPPSFTWSIDFVTHLRSNKRSKTFSVSPFAPLSLRFHNFFFFFSFRYGTMIRVPSPEPRQIPIMLNTTFIIFARSLKTRRLL